MKIMLVGWGLFLGAEAVAVIFHVAFFVGELAPLGEGVMGYVAGHGAAAAESGGVGNAVDPERANSHESGDENGHKAGGSAGGDDGARALAAEAARRPSG
jgi:hypothetical protein